MISRGYLLTTFGQNYVNEAYNFVKMLRKVEDFYPVSVLCSQYDYEYAIGLNCFDKVIIFDFNNPYSNEDKTRFERFGGTPKIMMVDYLPYDETMYLDSDMIVQSNPISVWEYMKKFNQPYVVTGINVQDNSMINYFCNKKKLDVNDVYSIHSGIVYMNKLHSEFEKFSSLLKYYWKTENYEKFGLSIMDFRGGKADEHAIFAAYATMGYKAISGLEHPIITHNYHKNIELPSNIVTGGTMYQIVGVLDSPIPFVHMFKECGKEHYETLFKRLINI